MTAKEHDDDADYYSLLNCSKHATFEELKRNYQQLIRIYHPDKSNDVNENFLNIDRAWKTLRDENLRKQYDIAQEQNILDKNTVIHAELCRGELCFNKDQVASYPCRCGSSFIVYQEYLSETEFIVECNQCSNCIIIK